MSYCTKHPGKDAVGACCECGHLVCKACYTELNDKVYCSSCANKLFTIREQEAPRIIVTPPPIQQTPQQPVQSVPPKAAEPVKQTVQPEPVKPAEPVKQPAQAAQPRPDVIITPPPAATPPKPALAAVPVTKDIAPEVKKEIAAPAPVKAKPAQPATSATGNMGILWWLAPVFLAFIGGLLAWLMNKSREPGKAKAMLFTGIGLTVAYAAAIAGFVLLSGSSSAQGSIVFARNSDKSWQIWAMDPDGKNAAKFTTCDNNSMYFNVYPGWSSLTKKLICYSNRDGNFEIYSVDADGSNQTNLTLNNYADYFPDWSPDGKKIVFMSNRDGNNEIYLMNDDGSNIKQLTISKPSDERPRWSPDGSQIVFNTDRDGNHEIYVMNVDGSNQHRLTTNTAWDGMARWSPDEKKITFVSERDGNPEIYIMDADGANQKRITFNSAKDYTPCFSPDGTRIVYYSNMDGNDEIYIMNPDGGNQVRITANKEGDQYPVWINAKLIVPAELKAQPVRTKFIGSNISTTNKYFNFSDNVTFVKYVAEKDGSVDMIKVYSGAAGKVKAAIYDHNAKDDAPLGKLSANNEPVPCQVNQWNNIYIPPVTLTKGTAYWLAFNSDVNGVIRQGTGQTKMLTGKAVFEDFTFPDKAPGGMIAGKWDFSISCWGAGEALSTDEEKPEAEDN
jgi:Tol biopolymer transport system component